MADEIAVTLSQRAKVGTSGVAAIADAPTVSPYC
jgi:hypothetical protein